MKSAKPCRAKTVKISFARTALPSRSKGSVPIRAKGSADLGQRLQHADPLFQGGDTGFVVCGLAVQHVGDAFVQVGGEVIELFATLIGDFLRHDFGVVRVDFALPDKVVEGALDLVLRDDCSAYAGEEGFLQQVDHRGKRERDRAGGRV